MLDRGCRGYASVMCGRFAMDKETDELVSEFVAAGNDFHDWRPGYNISPTDTVPIVVESSRGTDTVTRFIVGARWSLVPSWSKELKLKVPTFNARAETAASKPTFKASVAGKRALIPATGYYEWHTVGKTKTPYFVHDPEGGLLAFAGLYSWWRASRDDEWVLTATILTSDAIGPLRDIHDRTPLTLPRPLWDEWLDPATVGDQSLVDAALEAARPVADALALHRVGPVTGDGPELMLPIEERGGSAI